MRQAPSDAAGRLGSHATDAAPFTLAEPAPDAELLAVTEGELEALLAHHAAAADLLGLPRRCAPLGKEQVGIDAEAVGMLLPALVVEIARRVVLGVDDGLHWPGPLPWSLSGLGRRGVQCDAEVQLRRCNYITVIVAYHITFAQARIFAIPCSTSVSAD